MMGAMMAMTAPTLMLMALALMGMADTHDAGDRRAGSSADGGGPGVRDGHDAGDAQSNANKQQTSLLFLTSTTCMRLRLSRNIMINKTKTIAA